MRDQRTPKKPAVDRFSANREARWLAQNQPAIDSINTFIDRRGLLAARLRYRPEQREASHAR
jgi:hypothetical protein